MCCLWFDEIETCELYHHFLAGKDVSQRDAFDLASDAGFQQASVVLPSTGIHCAHLLFNVFREEKNQFGKVFKVELVITTNPDAHGLLAGGQRYRIWRAYDNLAGSSYTQGRVAPIHGGIKLGSSSVKRFKLPGFEVLEID